MGAIFTKWFPTGFRLIDGSKLNSWFNVPQSSTEDSITAATVQTQAGAYQLSALISRVSVCANAGDCVKLGKSSKFVGSVVTVINDGAQNLTVFSFDLATIDGTAGATGVTVGNGKRTDFYCVADGVWSSAGASKST